MKRTVQPHPTPTPRVPAQLIYDLLVRSSSPQGLELREDPDLGVVVAGLKHIAVTSPAEIMVRMTVVYYNTYVMLCCNSP
jgi:hypothetical protein